MAKKPLFLFLSGMGMGVADLIPGISGGTVLFFLGLYDEFIQKISSLPKNFSSSFSFLAPLFLGISCSILGFSPVVHQILQNEGVRPYFYSFLLGVMCATFRAFNQTLSPWKTKQKVLWLCGFLLILFLIFFPKEEMVFSDRNQKEFFFLFLIGMVTSFAMLLPGISGSYILLFFGIYPVAIFSLNEVLEMMMTLKFSFYPFQFLCSLGLGILAGIFFFSKVFSSLLFQYKKECKSLLFGCMAAGLTTLWPFCTYFIQERNGKIILLPKQYIFPEIISTSLFISFFSFLFGFFLYRFLEKRKDHLRTQPSQE